MKERLQKIISERGITSRRKAELLISSGAVIVNGIAASLGDTADPDVDEILVEGKPIPSAEKKVYIILNKPRGYVTTLSDEKGRPDAASLVSACGVRVYPIGRLDMDSEGLLLFTNDGNFANQLMHPSKEINKTYIVHATGYSEEAFTALHNPISLDGYQIRKPDLKLIQAKGERVCFEITIHEGRNRQIRRMCEAVGMKVTRLKRIQEGSVLLGNLPSGKWRYLTENELKQI